VVLRNQVEWALHCCSVLSALEPGEYLGTKKLAEFHGVPKEYLSKALQALAGAGLIEGTLGPSGGYRLAKSPKQISFLDVVEAIEGRTQTFECSEIRANNPCLGKADKKFAKVCVIAKVMYRADEAWRKELRSVTLADLGSTLQKEVPSEYLKLSTEWLRGR
jgi:Rrf2 family protein